MPKFRAFLRLGQLVLAVVVAGSMLGCGTDGRSGKAQKEAPSPTSKADSVAHRLLKAHGADALASAPYLRFTFAVETPSGTRTLGRHFWDRRTGEYRVEWTATPDSQYVAIINVRTQDGELPDGNVYLNGTRLTGAPAKARRRHAYERFINDTYWLLAPVKVNDPGVNRTYLPDSSTARHDVVHLTFGEVGLTPGDEYWLYVSTETGRLDQWAFHLQSMDEQVPSQRFDWTADTTLQAPDGPVTLSRRKEAINGPKAILTTDLALPSDPPEKVFSASVPILGGRSR